MAQEIKALATKPDDLNSILRTHVMELENPFLKFLKFVL